MVDMEVANIAPAPVEAGGDEEEGLPLAWLLFDETPLGDEDWLPPCESRQYAYVCNVLLRKPTWVLLATLTPAPSALRYQFSFGSPRQSPTVTAL
jgi:hypothetical protein